MKDGPSRPGPAQAGIPYPVAVTVDDVAWRRAVRQPELVVRRALAVSGGHANVVLASDRVIQRLNARHRDRNSPTNVLTFDPHFAGLPGEILLAFGTVRREAHAARRSMAHHLAHLVIHGSLHLQGHDHHAAGPARAMEQREAWMMRRLRLPNPWKHQ